MDYRPFFFLSARAAGADFFAVDFLALLAAAFGLADLPAAFAPFLAAL
jgi:hypothetical protein